MGRKAKLTERVYQAMCKLGVRVTNERKLAMWRKWRKVTGYSVYGLLQ